MNQLKDWENLTQKFSKRMVRWKASLLSIGGRMTLITSVLGALGIYYFSLFRVPATILSKLESMRSKFFWGGSEDSKKLAWVNWPMVLASKSVGGLGIGSLKALNLALLYKWRWRILTNNTSLWAKVILSIHGSESVFTLHTKQNGLWAQICKAITVIHGHQFLPSSVTSRQVGNGHNTRFWNDVWIGDSTLSTRYPRLFALENRPDCFISERITANVWSWDWRRDIRGGREESQLAELLETLQQVSLNDKPDCWSWNLNGNTCFAVRDIRYDLDLSILPVEDKSTRWNSLVPKKVNIFIWRLLRDRIPTRFNLSCRGIEIPSICCSICHTNVETSSHLFRTCNFSMELRVLMESWLQLEIPETSPSEILDWITGLRVLKKFKIILEAIFLTWWWALWKHRNNVVFNGSTLTSIDIFKDIVSSSFFWINCRNRKDRIVWPLWQISPNYLM